MSDLEHRRKFLIASRDRKNQDFLAEIIGRRISGAQVYRAQDGAEAASKIHNDPPNVIILDLDLAKITGLQLIKTILADKELNSVAIILTSIPNEDSFLDNIVTGRVQMIEKIREEKDLVSCLNRALNFVSHGDVAEYYLRFLGPRDLLIKQSEKPEFVFIVRKGRLRAFIHEENKDTENQGAENKEADVTLGFIEPGEFVGEMAFINGESRTANVEAVTDCELIEVPFGTLEHILFRRPAWSRALMVTLSKRLKNANKNVNNNNNNQN